MKLHVPAPRLLPMTIAVLGALLAVKTVGLVRAAGLPARAGFDLPLSPLQLASSEGGHGKPAEKASAHKEAEKPGGKKEAEKKEGDKKEGKTAEAPPPEPPPEPSSPPEPPFNETERALLLELRQRRQALEDRESAMGSREAMLAAAERKLTSRVDELQTLQGKLEALEAARTQREDAGWQGLVKVYESMKPREAAAIFNDMDMPVLLPVMDRMKEAKAALVLAAMNPDKARDVTTQLAHLRTRRDPPSRDAARETTRDQSRDAARDQSRDAARDQSRETARDPARRDAASPPPAPARAVKPAG